MSLSVQPSVPEAEVSGSLAGGPDADPGVGFDDVLGGTETGALGLVGGVFLVEVETGGL